MSKNKDKSSPREKGGLKRRFIEMRDNFRSNAIYIRTVSLLTAVTLLTFGTVSGCHHSNVVQSERARTISNLEQEIIFSKTGVPLSLKQHYRNDNITVVPVQIAMNESMSFDAKDYKLMIRPVGKEKLSESIKGSFVLFGTTGTGAIVLRGPMKQGPMQVILRNDENYVASSEGSGTIMLDGVETPVDFNAVSFVINPKGVNVKQNDVLQKDMSVSDLYQVAFGNDQYKTIKRDMKNAQTVLDTERKKLEENKRKLASLNKALGYKEDDRIARTNENTSVNDSVSGDYSDLDSDVEIEKADLSNADLEALRNVALSTVQASEDKIEQTENDIKVFEMNRKKIDKLVETMPNLTTTSDRFSIEQ